MVTSTSEATRKAELVADRTFYTNVVAILKQTFGASDQTALSGFGITPPKTRAVPSSNTKAIAHAKSLATRAARGTMGKKQPAMHASPRPSAFEIKLIAMENGFNNFPVSNAQLTFGREVLSPGEVVKRFQGIVTTIQDVQTTQDAHLAAVKASEKAMPSAHAFYEQAVTVVKAHFGSDPKILATFGLGTPRKASKPVPMVVIEQVIMPAKAGDATVAFASSISDTKGDTAVEELIVEESGRPARHRAFPERSRGEPRSKGSRHPHIPKRGRGLSRTLPRG